MELKSPPLVVLQACREGARDVREEFVELSR